MTSTDLMDEVTEHRADDRLEVVDATGSDRGTAAGRAGRSGRGRRRAVTLLAVLCLAGIAWLVLEILRATGTKAPADGTAAVAAGRTQALNMMTLDYRTAKRDLQRVVDGSTGTMKDQYAKAMQGTIASTASEKSSSKGTITSAGLASLKGNAAEVLVAGDATVSFPKSAKQAASTIVVRYRFRVDLQNVNGVWKSSKLSFAGLPSYSQVGS